VAVISAILALVSNSKKLAAMVAFEACAAYIFSVPK
jgi:hypothetical protein